MNLTIPSATRRLFSAAAAVLTLGLITQGVAVVPPADAAPVTLASEVAVPSGVAVAGIDWHDGGEAEHSRRVDIQVTSAAMPEEPITIEMQLARDWYTHPEETFASVWMLGGIYGSDESNAWLDKGHADEWYADKNVNLIMPVGGGGTFYTDWVNQDRGETIRWETFLTSELPALLARDFRTDDRRAVMGVSMGATASMTLAGRHPGVFRFAGSFSGYLDMSTTGMPEAVDVMLRIWGRESGTNMWGPLGSQGWRDHDPKLLLDTLRDIPLYVYAGSGTLKPGEQTDSPDTAVTDQAGEALARLSTLNFLRYAEEQGVDVHADLRNDGAHNWNSWIPAMKDTWPLIAAALGV
ncbi:alpha/beta hydrolase [Corynebacterium terpenotabidum]|uniref:Acyl-CoA:diacylglycerol acyltransferase n=1 Tax=Corynebacterium terpenotabidum Y-11 TaxID=1200352 RepID=S4X9R3_9CORY|nr:alpha/beta hydrolase family protein [Corynebacterium terpenotabidum]AGP29857.1 trehalose corynomycolyl transferase [Corynebacterium terpenotabidum Y-11]